MERGILILVSSEGPAYEKVAGVSRKSAASALGEAYINGQRVFTIDSIEKALCESIYGRRGMTGLAELGFVVVRQIGGSLELRLEDVRLAWFINLSRLGPQPKGFGIRPLTEAALCLRHPKRRGIHMTADRRLQVAIRLGDFEIDCEDILSDRKRIRLFSRWTLGRAA